MSDSFEDIINRYVKQHNKQCRDDIEMRQQQFAAMDEALFALLILLRCKFKGTPKMALYHDSLDVALPPVEAEDLDVISHTMTEEELLRGLEGLSPPEKRPEPSIADWPTMASRG